MASWINVIMLVIPLFVLLAPLAIHVKGMNEIREGQFELQRHYLRWGMVFLVIYLAALGATIYMLPRLLTLPSYHV